MAQDRLPTTAFTAGVIHRDSMPEAGREPVHKTFWLEPAVHMRLLEATAAMSSLERFQGRSCMETASQAPMLPIPQRQP